MSDAHGAGSTVVADLVAHQERQRRLGFFGIYRGKVISVGTSSSDKEGRLGQLKVAVPDVYGSEQQTLPWANCVVPFAGDNYGVMMLPKEGDGVWVQFEAGNKDLPVWVGAWYAQNKALPDGAAAETRVVRTPKGHTIVLDDDGNLVQLTHKDGQKITLSSDSIKLEVNNGCTVEIGQSSVKINDTALEVSK